jgi:hypothetical protein
MWRLPPANRSSAKASRCRVGRNPAERSLARVDADRGAFPVDPDDSDMPDLSSELII